MRDQDEAVIMTIGGVDRETIMRELGINAQTLNVWIRNVASNVRDERNAAVIEAYRNPDNTVNDVLNEFEISQGTLYRIISKHNVPLRRTRGATHDEQDDSQIISLYTRGAKLFAIRKATGRSYTYIYEVLRNANTTLRRS